MRGRQWLTSARWLRRWWAYAKKLRAHDHMASGRGAPEAEDMERFKEESGALADLWESTVAP